MTIHQTHSLAIPETLIIVVAICLCVIATVQLLRLIDLIGERIERAALRKEADEILGRVGAVPRGIRNHGVRDNGVSMDAQGMAEKY